MTLKTRCNKVNDLLYKIGLQYWQCIPIYQIDSALIEYGFNATEAGLYTGRDGRHSEEIGEGKYIHLSWHKMESGCYEIVAYLN